MTFLSKLPIHLSKALLTVAVLGSASNAMAATTVASPSLVLQQPNVSLALANQLINATKEACRAQGKSMVVAVVDRGGNLVAVQRDDDVGPHNTGAAIKKAFTALSTKTPSRTLADNARANPDSNNLNTVDDLLLIGGGVPIRFGGEVIGAIAGGGAGGAVQDESCAIQGIKKVLPNQKQ